MTTHDVVKRRFVNGAAADWIRFGIQILILPALIALMTFIWRIDRRVLAIEESRFTARDGMELTERISIGAAERGEVIRLLSSLSNSIGRLENKIDRHIEEHGRKTP